MRYCQISEDDEEDDEDEDLEDEEDEEEEETCVILIIAPLICRKTLFYYQSQSLRYWDGRIIISSSSLYNHTTGFIWVHVKGYVCLNCWPSDSESMAVGVLDSVSSAQKDP